ncbi:hypothetical protein Asp14428_57150 [Actinoplanes sp. NBRC 14428]|nr:hypothetical protein Asp14428_57150 [Actinoplanes sp. NBRC 14428]
MGIGLLTFIRHPVPQLIFAAFVVLSWPLSGLAGRDTHRRLAAAALVVSAGAIIALTATPSFADPATFAANPPHFLTLLDRPGLLARQLVAPPSDLEQVANIALYVPLGISGAMLWRRWLPATAFGFLLVLAIETVQYVIPGRAGSITDIRNNTLGALLGAVLTAVLRRRR